VQDLTALAHGTDARNAREPGAATEIEVSRQVGRAGGARPASAPIAMTFVHGTTRILGHCTFAWREQQTDGTRIVEVEPHHCQRCITELRRGRRAELIMEPTRWPNGSHPPPPSSHVGSVLVVDDDDETRTLFADTLREHGYLVVEARNGKEALAALLAMELPTVILLDLSMPVMSGWEVLRVMRSIVRLSRIPVVLVSADELAAATRRGPLDRLLTKPVSPEKILHMVNLYASRARNGETL
jgi:CheY-like chemotaxis protein